VLLTAVHFHFAGFAAPLLAGLAARRLLPASRDARARRLLAALCFAVVIGTPLLAAGITFSRTVERAAGLLLASAVAALGALHVGVLCRKAVSRLARLCFALSGLSAVVAMALAAAYALRELAGVPLLTIPQMARSHGWLNACGFTLAGLIAWHVEAEPT
jgi:hypothetical protein